MPVAGDVALELVAEAVLPLPMATCPANQSVRRSPALPYFDSLVWPRKVPDCWVARSRPQNFRNWR